MTSLPGRVLRGVLALAHLLAVLAPLLIQTLAAHEARSLASVPTSVCCCGSEANCSSACGCASGHGLLSPPRPAPESPRFESALGCPCDGEDEATLSPLRGPQMSPHLAEIESPPPSVGGLVTPDFLPPPSLLETIEKVPI